MRGWLRILAIVCALIGAGLGYALLSPSSSLDAASSDQAALAAFETRAARHFAHIAAGEGLDRPFPEPVVDPGNDDRPAKVALGRLLYFDPILSGDDSLSCAHCHHPDLGFSDNRGLAMGVGGEGIGPDRTGGATLRRGSPTVWNAGFNHVQFWDGRARDLEEQAGKPITDALEMNQDEAELEAELRAIPAYAELFSAAFGVPASSSITFERVTFAIAAFERTLVSQDSRYDRYARGDRHAMSPAERRGLNVFRSLQTRCFECHNLPTFANRDFKVIGVPEPAATEAPDLGRAEVVGGALYARAFKVPTLRNVALTAPYMHNGAFETLGEVIDFYADGGGAGLGLDLPNLDDKIRRFEISEAEKADLVAFLHALTDESAKPSIPDAVPSGLPVVPALENASPELAAFEPVEEVRDAPVVRRDGNRLVVYPGERIQDAIDAARPGDTVQVMPGQYHETLTLDRSDLTLEGLVRDGERAVLDGRGVLADAVIGAGSRLVIQGFAMRRYTANGVMINLGTDLVFRDLHLDDTGLYGVYPVEVVGVLVEDCTVTGTRDAGIYVGQSKDIVVRGNVAHGNVTGIEIENSVDALVEDNEVYDNTGGILVFGLPNVPSKVARGCVVRGNRVHDNNRANFADPTAVVAGVPAGTGILILGADQVEVTDNEIHGNASFAIAVAGLDTFFGGASGYDLDPHPDDNWIHGNTFSNNGGAPDAFVTEAGYQGADLLWDLSGRGNRWDQPGASRLPYALPASDWPAWRRRANQRFWRLASKLSG